ncbi:YxiG-like protein [Streptomyces agglomeratus]|uniref:YxiG-like protein n=1 Tax=Streptomyces agglomeratus TaxID=285458 RepID=UPI000D1B2293
MLNSASAGPLVHLRYLFRYCLEARCETSVQAETWRSLLILLGPRTVSDSEVGVALGREGRVGAEALSDVRRGWGCRTVTSCSAADIGGSVTLPVPSVAILR